MAWASTCSSTLPGSGGYCDPISQVRKLRPREVKALVKDRSEPLASMVSLHFLIPFQVVECGLDPAGTGEPWQDWRKEFGGLASGRAWWGVFGLEGEKSMRL